MRSERHEHRPRRDQEAWSPEGHGHFHRHRGTRSPRAHFVERGGIKFVVLELLREQPRHGYDIMREMEERSGGVYTPSPGAIYPTLQALEDQDLVVSTTHEGKKVYAITEAGAAFLEEHKERAKRHGEPAEAYWASEASGESWATASAIRGTMADIRRLVRANASDLQKLAAIKVILEEAAERITEVVGRQE